MIIAVTITGTAAAGQTWECKAQVDAEWTDNDLMGRAMQESFQQLTSGKAVFGKPGVGCSGPYKITRVEMVPS